MIGTKIGKSESIIIKMRGCTWTAPSGKTPRVRAEFTQSDRTSHVFITIIYNTTLLHSEFLYSHTLPFPAFDFPTNIILPRRRIMNPHVKQQTQKHPSPSSVILQYTKYRQHQSPLIVNEMYSLQQYDAPYHKVHKALRSPSTQALDPCSSHIQASKAQRELSLYTASAGYSFS